MRKGNLPYAISFLFMFLFLYAAISKLLDYDLFRAQMGRSPMIMTYSAVLAWMVPLSELVVAALLFVPKTRLIGFFCSFTLMLVFTGYIILILKFSPYIPCSCGGILSTMGWTEHLIFNIGFTLLAITGIFTERTYGKTELQTEQTR